MEVKKKNRTFSMDIAREICTDSFYTVNSGTPRIPVTAVYQLFDFCSKDIFSVPLNMVGH